MCTVLLPPGVNPTAVNKYIIPYHIISYLFGKADGFFAAALMRHPFFWDMRLDI